MRVTSQHWVEFLSIAERQSLITSKFNGAQGKAEGNALWNSVATKLNSLGFGKKSVAEWRRAVTDWKSKVKVKASKLRVSFSQTGGGPVDIPPLTPLEDRLLILMGKKGFEGDEGVKELGFGMAVPNPLNNSTKPLTKPHSATNFSFLKPASTTEPASNPEPASIASPAMASNQAGGALKATQYYGIGHIFQNTLQDMTYSNDEASTPDKPIDENYEEDQEHDYCRKRKINQSQNKDLSPTATPIKKFKIKKLFQEFPNT